MHFLAAIRHRFLLFVYLPVFYEGMKLAFAEIWSFLDIVGDEAHLWSFRLRAGDFLQENITPGLIAQLKEDAFYDPEILPNLFTFREIFWQPNVYPTLNACLTGLKLVANYSHELTEQLDGTEEPTVRLYTELVHHIGQLAVQANEMLSADETAAEKLPAVLGEFRKQAFPVIMLFIHHPMNRADYKEDALRRINFMVKTLIEQYQLRFNDLLLPHWELARPAGADSQTEITHSGEASSETNTESPT